MFPSMVVGFARVKIFKKESLAEVAGCMLFELESDVVKIV